jgi:hypothetical protein
MKMAKLVTVFQVIRSTTSDFMMDFQSEDEAVDFILSQDDASSYRIVECKKVVAEVVIYCNAGNFDNEALSIVEKVVADGEFKSLHRVKTDVMKAFLDKGISAHRIEEFGFSWK